jgi:hypothetical protein
MGPAEALSQVPQPLPGAARALAAAGEGQGGRRGRRHLHQADGRRGRAAPRIHPGQRADGERGRVALRRWRYSGGSLIALRRQRSEVRISSGAPLHAGCERREPPIPLLKGRYPAHDLDASALMRPFRRSAPWVDRWIVRHSSSPEPRRWSTCGNCDANQAGDVRSSPACQAPWRA